MKYIVVTILLVLNILASDIKLEHLRQMATDALDSSSEDKLVEAKERFEKLLKEKYTSTRASYLGSLTSKMALYSYFPWSKISYAKNGSKLLEKALKEEPNNPEIRLNRFFTYISFPDFLNKSIFIQEDARWFIKELKENQNLSYEMKQNIYKALSMFFIKQKDEARYKKYFSLLKDEKMIEKVNKYKNEQ